MLSSNSDRDDRYNDEDFARHKAQAGIGEWQPAIIAPREHVAKLHSVEPGFVSRYAGAVVRVRENEACRRSVGAQQKLYLGCPGHAIEVHPEDAARLWPEDFEEYGNVALCTCAVLTD